MKRKRNTFTTLVSILLISALSLSLTACGNEKASMDRSVGNAVPAAEANGAIAPDYAVDAEYFDAPSFEEDSIAYEWADEGGDSGHIIGEVPQSNVRSGMLTCGEWRDNYNWEEWIGVLNSSTAWQSQPMRWKLYPSSRLIVDVKDEDGNPIQGATVSGTRAHQENEVWVATTDHNGRAYFFEEDGNVQSTNKIDKFTASLNGVYASIERQDGDSYFVHEIVLAGTKPLAKSLDLMLVLDTTASMGSELEYLKAELEDVIKTVRNDNGNIPVRLSVNFFRDKGDDYVVLPHEFTTDISAAMEILRQQSAGGGGDWPEALDEALIDAVFEKDWAEDSVKVMLLVTDAPAHNRPDAIANLQKSIRQAAALGIRIVPILASGSGGALLDLDVEFLLRTFAVQTGGTFLFLTEHSGIGSDHKQPTIGGYQVEMLNRALVRIINMYCA